MLLTPIQVPPLETADARLTLKIRWSLQRMAVLAHLTEYTHRLRRWQPSSTTRVSVQAVVHPNQRSKWACNQCHWLDRPPWVKCSRVLPWTQTASGPQTSVHASTCRCLCH